jgi:putative phage-type endonuclease
MEDRKGFIGGSEIAAVMGLSPWKTPLQLWLEKTGAIEPKDLSDNEAVQMGNELEETVARLFTKRSGKEVRRSPKQYIDKEFSFMRCQVDRLVTGSDELVECKTASLRKEKDWSGDEIPADYILQVQWQLMITGRSIGWIAVLIGGQKFLFKQIKEDVELQATMREAADKFWSMVESKQAPMAMLGDDDALLALYPKNNEELALMNDMETAVARRMELIAQINDLTDEKELIEIQLKEIIKDQLGIKTDRYKITWKEQSSSRVNIDALKADGLYEKYLKTGSTRVLRVSLNKEKGK